MPRKKSISKTIQTMPLEYKNWLIAIVFIFFWAITFLSDTKSLFWNFLFVNLNEVFWYYYKWIFSPVLLLSALFLFKERNYHFWVYRWIWLFIFYVSITTIVWFFKSDYDAFFNIYFILENILWRNAVLFSFILLFILSLVILFRFSPVSFTKKIISSAPSLKDIKNTIKRDSQNPGILKTSRDSKIDKKKEEISQMLEQLKKEKENLKQEKQKKQTSIEDIPRKIIIEKKQSKISKLFDKKSWENTSDKQSTKPVIIENSEFKNWQLPELVLLDSRLWYIVVNENEIRTKEIEIQEKLLQFKIEVDMQGYRVWPTVIQYRLKPREWVKLQKIENLKKDLTLALHAKSIRIQAPIPGLWVVWIEVPNDNRQVVWLKEVLASKEFNNRKLDIPIAIWKDVNGDMVVWDLTKMPHLLVAGQTASWKSVWMNGFLISMLYKFSPSQLKMIMIDPKRVELSVYNGIPHLLTPVITNPDKALNSLKWCVAEMLRRYDLATKVNARNLWEYNAKVSNNDKLPYIVIVIDELADLMMSWSKKEVESSIARIAQMARAVWMHLIVATQRPSVDVITWLIKANIPSRIAFTVASQVDSRTVIDKQWAEDLLWRWDMLYSPTWALEAERVQWVLVETHEIEAVVNKLKLTIDPEMLKNMQDESIVNWQSKTAWSILEWYDWDQEEDPEIIEKALQVVKESKKGSTSLIQRKLWLGYSRAAKVLDILEDLGVVWPANGSKPRDVYVD